MGQIAQIGASLKTWAAKSNAKLLFGITSPMLADARADQDVMSLNRAAAAAMSAAAIPTVDLHVRTYAMACTSFCSIAPVLHLRRHPPG